MRLCTSKNLLSTFTMGKTNELADGCCFLRASSPSIIWWTVDYSLHCMLWSDETEMQKILKCNLFFFVILLNVMKVSNISGGLCIVKNYHRNSRYVSARDIREPFKNAFHNLNVNSFGWHQFWLMDMPLDVQIFLMTCLHWLLHHPRSHVAKKSMCLLRIQRSCWTDMMLTSVLFFQRLL